MAYASADSPVHYTTTTPTSITTLRTTASPQAVTMREPPPVYLAPADLAHTTFAVTSRTSVDTAEPQISVVPGTSVILSSLSKSEAKPFVRPIFMGYFHNSLLSSTTRLPPTPTQWFPTHCGRRESHTSTQRILMSITQQRSVHQIIIQFYGRCFQLPTARGPSR